MKKIILVLIVICMTFIYCGQYSARKFGGETTISLEPGEKVVEATWRGNSLWYLVEPMDSDYVPKTKIFKESSLMGIAEGEVKFIERR